MSPSCRAIGAAALGIAAAAAACVPPSARRPEAPQVSADRIAEAIQSHITAETEAGGGYFHVPFLGRTLELKLVRVHTEYLADLGDGSQFACVDLVGLDGQVYDVDFFMKGLPGPATVTQTTVHKIDGKPLYAWEQGKRGTWRRVDVANASDRLLGVIRGEDEFEFTYRARVPPLPTPGRLWMPVAQSDAYQSVRVVSLRAPGSPRELSESKHGNKVLLVELPPQNSSQSVEIVYHVRRREKSPYPAEGEHPADDLEPETLVPSTDSMEEIARGVVEGKSTDLMRARAIYDHVIEQVRYAKYGSGWGRGDAVYACDAKSGNCTDFHAYFIALARAVEIPARFAIGASIPSERQDGGIDGYHCWAEFFADGKWWPVDVSEADKNARLATYYFGHHPANRIELSRGRDLVVEPGPASGPINFLAYPVLEADGKPVQAKAEFLFRRHAKFAAGGRSSP